MARPRRPHLLPAAVLTAAALMASGCGGAAPSSTSAAPTTSASTTTTTTRPAPLSTTTTTLPAPIALRIGVAPSLAFAIPFVLADPAAGIGAANALDISVEVFDTSGEALASALAGGVDLVLPDGLEALGAIAGGACLQAPLSFVDVDAMRLVGRSDLITADDLIGLQVGTVAGSQAEVALRMWLLDQGVDWEEVEVVDTAPFDLAPALTEDRVDAVIWTEPLPAQALEACGQEACRYVGEVGESFREVSMVSVTCEWAQAAGDEGMIRLVRAWLEAREYVRNNIDAAAAITADRLRLTTAEVADRWRQRGWLDAWSADLDDAQLAMLQGYAAYLVEAGELAGAPEICSWVDSRWLRLVAPDLVTLAEYDC